MRRCGPWWFRLALFSLLWLDLIRLLSHTWAAREQYAYGWFVPLFALYFAWARNADRPAAHRVPAPFAMTVSVAIVLVLLLPLRIFVEINYDWGVLVWPYTLAIVWITLYALFLAGGWPWLRHFAFPIAFICVAVAWPWWLETRVTQGLMRLTTGLTVECLGALNVPAIQQGNLIEIGTGVVGVDDACSGIRSLQSSLTAALLMGELYRGSLFFRLILVACGALVAFICNLGRTVLLTYHAAAEGLDVLDRLHDPAGLTATVITICVLWAIGALGHRFISLSRAAVTSSQSGGQLNGVLDEQVAGAVIPRTGAHGRYLIGVGCWGLVVLAGTEGWYRLHPETPGNGVHWTVSLPTTEPSYSELELSPRTISLLGHDEGGGGTWTEADGSEWMVYFFRWSPQSIQSVIGARVHRPDVCLPAGGLKQLADHGETLLPVGRLHLPFHRYTFEFGEKPLHVFFCRWEDAEGGRFHTAEPGRRERIGWVLAGRRRLAQQTLQVMVIGPATMAEAEGLVQRQLPRLVQVSDTGELTDRSHSERL